ncbi:hypothetical protein FACS1894211_16750 [Clostridia bacterium]|nr:hypothetical protein FACS1894211_16750 [Clostridia bacterium]
MKVKKERLLQFLKESEMTATDLAREMGIDVSEVEKMLNGEAVCRKTAERFIHYFGADLAQRYIDWKAIGKKNPLACKADKRNGG